MAIPLDLNAQIAQAARDLLEEYLRLEAIFDSVQTDEEFSNLPANLTAKYRDAEDVFLGLAKKSQRTLFMVEYLGTSYSIQCCKDFENLQIDEAIALALPEVA